MITKQSKLRLLIFLCFLLMIGMWPRAVLGLGGGGSLPTSLDLPAEFVVQPSDWVDNERPAAGWPLHIGQLRGKAITERNGIHPIHVMRPDTADPDSALLERDDLIIGVNGEALGHDPENYFVQEVRRARRRGALLEVTRWRRGVIENVKLDPAGAAAPTIPDLTQGEQPDGTRDWSLGPLGVNGWGFSRSTDDGGSSQARQILITRVDEKGPSAGMLAVGDVMIGVNGTTFTWDARRALAAAINEAETEQGGGKLSLKVWRPKTAGVAGEGEVLDLIVQLPVLGTYSETAPFDCEKTEAIIDQAVAYMIEHQERLLQPADRGWLPYINGLGLLATGRDDVMPILKELAHGSLLQEGETLCIQQHVPMMSWWWSYRTIFLCEYYLRTGDEIVLPTIKEYATKIAMGQSGAGTWGHTYAAIENTGYMHGHLGGYGALNQQGLTLMIALPLAVKSGVTNQVVFDAIQRGDDFFSYFIGKGTIPYGDHGAKPWYDDNGKSGAAAVYFDIVENTEGREFFSEMVLGSAPSGRESGHTGHYWSHLWGGVGAARAGDKGLKTFMREMRAIFTLERQHDGRFVFQGNIGERGDIGEPKTQWDSTGARLLQLCVPRRTLYLTGKATPSQSHLSDARIEQILRAGHLAVDEEARARLDVDAILEWLEDPLPPVRHMAVNILEEREIHVVETLKDMLGSENRFARYGAAEALGRVGFANQAAADTLIRMMAEDADTQFRMHAINALDSSDTRLGLGIVAQSAIPVLLQMATEEIPDDPRRVLQHDIAQVLFFNQRGHTRRGLFATHGLEGVDTELLIPALQAILTNMNGRARSLATNFMYPRLEKEKLEMLWGDIYLATRRIAPSGIMFASEARTDGLDLLSRHHVEEGMYLAAWYVRWQKGHGARRRVPHALAALEKYGVHAQAFVPYLKEHAEHFRASGDEEIEEHILASIERIQATTERPALISIADYLDQEMIPPRDGP